MLSQCYAAEAPGDNRFPSHRPFVLASSNDQKTNESMEAFPFGYERIEGTTWAYLSSLLMLALFFKFNRFWSVRNLDLFLIIMLAPGLLMVDSGQRWVADYQKQQSKEAPVSAESTNALISLNSNPKATNLTGIDGDDSDEFQSESVGGSDVKTKTDLDSAKQKLIIQKPTTDTKGHTWQRWGYYWLFGIGAIFLVRMLIDPSLTRRPLLDSNLAIGGLVFLPVA